MGLTKEIVEKLIKEANTARKAIVIYPESHPTSLLRLQSFFSLLKALLKESSLTIGIKSDGFQLGEETIGLENPALQEFHSLLKNHEVLAIQFNYEVEENDLKKFFKFISVAPERISTEGGLKSFLEKEKLKGISIAFFDLKLADIKEEAKIKAGGEKQESERDVILKSLLLKPLILIADPSMKEKIEDIVKSTVDLNEIKSILNAVESALLSAKDDEALPVYKFLISILSSPVKGEYCFWLKELSQRNPSLFKRIASNIPKRILFEVLKGLEERGIERKELEVLHSLIFEKNRNRIENFLKTSAIVDDIPIFLHEDYHNVLNDMTERIVLPSPFPELKEEAQEEISEERVSEFLFEFYLEVLEMTLDEKDFSFVVERLLEYFKLYLQTAQFGKARLIISAFQEFKGDESKNSLIKKAIELMKSDEIIKLLIENLREVWGKEEIEEIRAIFHFIGVKAVPFLINSLMEEQDKYTRRLLIDIISELGGAEEIAISYLKSDKWYVVRNMLLIIRNSGKKEYIKDVLPCTEHPHHKVKIEAVKTLAQLGYEKIDEIIVSFIENPDFNLRVQALTLVSSLRLTTLVPYLNNSLKEIDLKNRNIPWIIALIRTLGELGDKSSLPILKKFAKGSMFYPQRTKLLRKEVYNSLHAFRIEDISDLVEKGLKSRDKEISEISYRLSRRISQ
ncbi:MAG: HEAT repeat domain-containing protein [Candidatus Aminicenantia bacterium]